MLGVNTNTVLRALRELRDQGLLEFRRGRGITVAGAPSRSAVISQARDLIKLAQRHGYPKDELIQIIQDIDSADYTSHPQRVRPSSAVYDCGTVHFRILGPFQAIGDERVGLGPAGIAPSLPGCWSMRTGW